MSDTEEFTDSDVIADRVLNDIELGDTITIETEYSFELTGTVTKQETQGDNREVIVANDETGEECSIVVDSTIIGDNSSVYVAQDGSNDSLLIQGEPTMIRIGESEQK